MKPRSNRATIERAARLSRKRPNLSWESIAEQQRDEVIRWEHEAALITFAKISKKNTENAA